MSVLQHLANAVRLVAHPVPLEKRQVMAARWSALDPRWRTVGQGLGQQATGCGATIAVHPRCDFACSGCYLGEDANGIAPADRRIVFRQLEQLRAWLGPKGNVQITDGEVTLLPVEDLVAIIQYARRLGLIPMVMTHGDSFRRRPGLLEVLITRGGLTEVSIHVDTTQRGRLGYKEPPNEATLMPLRDEFAAMIRAARRRTGRPLRAATTLTVARQNLNGVSDVVDWCLRNRDAFGMLSFQPMAHVGRTEAAPGITAAELWERIGVALSHYGAPTLGTGPLAFGHPDCTRIELLAVCQRGDARPLALPVVREQPEDRELLQSFFARGFGGINFRDDSALERVCRAVGILGSDPAWLLGPVRSWILERLRELRVSPVRLAWEVMRGEARIDGLAVVSHHFMSPAELDTEAGRDRLDACVFRVPIADAMVPMCQVNAGGIRDAYYTATTSGPGRSGQPAGRA